MKKLTLSIVLLFASVTLFAQSPKYIFYFIGDGMGFAHVQTTEAALAAREGKIGFNALNFTQFPYVGMAQTYCSNSLITDSAAAGTALATGEKTSSGTIGMNADHSQDLESIAVKAKNEGLKVGVLTSVSIDHATPAAFYAHQSSRSHYKEIANWLPKTGFDLYAGSGLLKISDNYYDSISKHCGYTVVRGKDAKLRGKKVVWVEKEGKSSGNIALAIDRKEDDMALAEMVERSIEYLNKDAKKGFFMMIEGGQIDWAAHSNDAASIVYETIDMDNAVAVALEFYKKYPTQTLIVVTADHETGGMTLGADKTGYGTKMDLLFTQDGSQGVVGKDKSKAINAEAGVGFTSGSHTAAFVPVFAIGVGAEKFSGVMNNTDIPKFIQEIIEKQ